MQDILSSRDKKIGVSHMDRPRRNLSARFTELLWQARTEPPLNPCHAALAVGISPYLLLGYFSAATAPFTTSTVLVTISRVDWTFACTFLFVILFIVFPMICPPSPGVEPELNAQKLYHTIIHSVNRRSPRLQLNNKPFRGVY